MGLVEACEAHQEGLNVESCFYLNPQEYVNIIFEQTLRGMAPSQPVGPIFTTPVERLSTHLDRCPCCDHRTLQPAQKRIDTAAHFGLEHGRFRCPFAEQNKKTGIIRLRQRTREGSIPATKQNRRQLYDYKSQANIHVGAVHLAAYFLFAVPDRSRSSCSGSDRLIACRWLVSPQRGDSPTR